MGSAAQYRELKTEEEMSIFASAERFAQRKQPTETFDDNHMLPN
jgi:hypothetical protein